MKKSTRWIVWIVLIALAVAAALLFRGSPLEDDLLGRLRPGEKPQIGQRVSGKLPRPFTQGNVRIAAHSSPEKSVVEIVRLFDAGVESTAAHDELGLAVINFPGRSVPIPMLRIHQKNRLTANAQAKLLEDFFRGVQKAGVLHIPIDDRFDAWYATFTTLAHNSYSAQKWDRQIARSEFYAQPVKDLIFAFLKNNPDSFSMIQNVAFINGSPYEELIVQYIGANGWDNTGMFMGPCSESGCSFDTFVGSIDPANGTLSGDIYELSGGKYKYDSTVDADNNGVPQVSPSTQRSYAYQGSIVSIIGADIFRNFTNALQGIDNERGFLAISDL